MVLKIFLKRYPIIIYRCNISQIAKTGLDITFQINLLAQIHSLCKIRHQQNANSVFSKVKFVFIISTTKLGESLRLNHHHE